MPTFCTNPYLFAGTYYMNSVTKISVPWHYNDVIMSTMTSHITSLKIFFLLNRLFRRRSKKTSKLRVTGLCTGNSPVTGEFPAQKNSNAENICIWWRHRGHYMASIIDFENYVTSTAGRYHGKKLNALPKRINIVSPKLNDMPPLVFYAAYLIDYSVWNEYLWAFFVAGIVECLQPDRGGWELIDSHGAGTVVGPFTTGRGMGTETCEIDNVFPPDDP